MRRLPEAAAAAASLIVCACSGGGSGYEAVPKPEAWPRAALCDTALIPVAGLPVNIEANAQATVTPAEGDAAANIVYPAYNATVYVTVVSGLDDPARFGRAWDNRLERMQLNLGGTPRSTASAVNDAGFSYTVATARSLTQTPVQLIAGNPATGQLVSATAFFHNRGEDFDSVRPYIDALEADLLNMARRLR